MRTFTRLKEDLKKLREDFNHYRISVGNLALSVDGFAINNFDDDKKYEQGSIKEGFLSVKEIPERDKDGIVNRPVKIKQISHKFSRYYLNNKILLYRILLFIN